MPGLRKGQTRGKQNKSGQEIPSTRKLPVVVLTSSDLGEDIERCYELGANRSVSKPVDLGEFNKAVSEVGFYWLMLNKVPET